MSRRPITIPLPLLLQACAYLVRGVSEGAYHRMDGGTDGALRVLEQLNELIPNAPCVTVPVGSVGETVDPALGISIQEAHRRAASARAGAVVSLEALEAAPDEPWLVRYESSKDLFQRAWWRPGKAGYSVELGGAGLYTREEAEAIAREREPGVRDVAYPLSAALAMEFGEAPRPNTVGEWWARRSTLMLYDCPECGGPGFTPDGACRTCRTRSAEPVAWDILDKKGKVVAGPMPLGGYDDELRAQIARDRDQMLPRSAPHTARVLYATPSLEKAHA